MKLCSNCDSFDLRRFGTVLDGLCLSPLRRHINGLREGCEFCKLLIDSFTDDVDSFEKTYERHLLGLMAYASTVQINALSSGHGLGVTSLTATLYDGRDSIGETAQFAVAAEKSKLKTLQCAE
jgi:hypothetical protein